MSSAKATENDFKKLLAKLRPEIHQQIDTDIKKLDLTVKEISQGGLMGIFLGAILAPLAATISDAGAFTAFVAKLIGGVGNNMLSHFLLRFYNAGSTDDDDVKLAVLAEIVDLLQSETDRSYEMREELQKLIQRVDAFVALRITLGEEAKNAEEKLTPLRPIPADLMDHRRFVRRVKKLFQLKRSHIKERFYLGGEHSADLLVTDQVHGEPLSTVVQCVTTRQGRADEKMLINILGWLPNLIRQHKISRGMIVTDKQLSPAAQGQAEGAGWKVRLYDDLLDDLMDFSNYLDGLLNNFTKPRNDSDLPALAEYYVPLKALNEPATDDSESFDLLRHVQSWIARPSPAKPLMLLGGYGTGKTTFSRKLAFELAQVYRQRQDRLLAGHPIEEGPGPRLPLFINLLDFVENRKIDALIIYYLDKHCHVDHPRYELFEALNEAGFFVIILDGFDEMAVRVDSATVERHLHQIEKLAKPPNSRVVLTGRPEFFKNREELERGLWPHTQILANRLVKFEMLWLQLWDNDQICHFLDRLVPHLPNQDSDGRSYYKRIKNIHGFDDLAQRAVLLEMIAQTLPLFDKSKPITRVNLYQLYLVRELERQRLKKDRDLLIPDAMRFELLQKLAVDSYQAEGDGINYQAAEAVIKPRLSTEEQASPARTEHHTRELLSCSFLCPGPGHLFVFSHRTFRSYFAAKEIMPRLLDGTAEAQSIDQDCIYFLAEMMAEHCTRAWYQTQTEAALAKEGLPDWIEKKYGSRYISHLPSGMEIEMIYIPAGPYLLGAEGKWPLPPQIAVLEKSFWMDKTLVTTEQFNEFVKHTKYVTAAEKNGGGWILQGIEWKQDEKAIWKNPFSISSELQEFFNYPVLQVSWDDAQAFAKWSGKVLPFERQWEKASHGIDGRLYPWGNIWNRDKCNSASWWAERDLFKNENWTDWLKNEFKQRLSGKQVMTTTTDHFAKFESPYGCVDTAGNAWEWCLDKWNENEEMRVLRGGAWYNRPHNVVCAMRNYDFPDNRNFSIGFRCART